MTDLPGIDPNTPGVAGVDEVGRGPLAGDVVAAAVILDLANPVAGLRDSKKLSAKRREVLAVQIREQAVAWAIGRASVAEIDSLNVLQASLLAMRRAVEALQPQPVGVLVDGNRLPVWSYPALAVIGGDDSVAAIAAASILAKVQRDAELTPQRLPHSAAFAGIAAAGGVSGAPSQLRAGQKPVAGDAPGVNLPHERFRTSPAAH